MIRKPNLREMSFFQVKKLSKELCEKTIEEIAEEVSVGHEHIGRHFRDPKYNVSPAMLPSVCKAMGNNLQIEWQVVQIGGTMPIVDPGKLEDMSVDAQVSKTMTESADVLKVWSQAMLDGVRTPEESAELEAQLVRLIRKATECRETLRMLSVNMKSKATA